MILLGVFNLFLRRRRLLAQYLGMVISRVLNFQSLQRRYSVVNTLETHCKHVKNISQFQTKKVNSGKIVPTSSKNIIPIIIRKIIPNIKKHTYDFISFRLISIVVFF